MGQNNQNLYDYIEIFYRRKWLWIIPLLLGTGIGTLVSVNLPSYYRSTTLVLIEQQQVPEAYVKPTDTTPIQARLNTINQQIMSRTKLEQIINNLKLYREGDEQGIPEILKKPFSFLGISAAKTAMREEVVEQMRKDIEVQVESRGEPRGKGGDAFRISYTNKNPVIAKQVTDTLASLFIEENLKVREQYAEGTSEFLANELENAQKELEEQEKALQGFKEKNIGRLPEQLDANLRTLDRLQLELQTVQAALKNAGDRKVILEEQISLMSTMTSIDQQVNTRVNTIDPLKAELTRLEAELTTLLSTYKENYPDVVILKNRISEVERQLKSSRGKVEPSVEQQPDKAPVNTRLIELSSNLAQVKPQIEAFKKQEAGIRNQISIYQKRVEDTPGSEQMLSNIKRGYDTSRNNYQSLLEKKLSARLAENLEKRQKSERFKILDPANLPEKPYKPDKNKIVTFGMLFGAGLGAGLVFIMEFLNPAFRKPEDFAGILAQPVLATIPAFSVKAAKKSEKRFMVIKGRKK